ncbi:hypothetical protein ACJJTC_005127 [Scirpophaga incertulas]
MVLPSDSWSSLRFGQWARPRAGACFGPPPGEAHNVSGRHHFPNKKKKKKSSPRTHYGSQSIHFSQRNNKKGGHTQERCSPNDPTAHAVVMSLRLGDCPGVSRPCVHCQRPLSNPHSPAGRGFGAVRPDPPSGPAGSQKKSLSTWEQ